MSIKALAVLAALAALLTALTGSGWVTLIVGVYGAAWLLGR